MKFELVPFPFVNRNAEDVCRQKIAGELYPLVIRSDDSGKGMRQRGFSNPGNVFDQKMPAGQQTAESKAYLFIFSEQDVVDGSPCFQQALVAAFRTRL